MLEADVPMKPARLFSILLPLIVGVGMVFMVPQVHSLVQLEQAIFWYPERHDRMAYTTYSQDEAMALRVFEVGSSKQSATTLKVDAETLDILTVEEMSPANWAYLLSEIPSPAEHHLVIPSGLSWEAGGEIPLRALAFELEKFNTVALGLEFGAGAADPLPEYLKTSVIPDTGGFPKKLTSVGAVIKAPSTEATLYGFTAIQGLTGELPLLARWGNDLLPSLALARLINRLDLTTAGVKHDSRGFLILGESQAILPIDEKGFLIGEKWTSETAPTSAASILLEPARELSDELVLTEGGPGQELAMGPPSLTKTYRPLAPLPHVSFILLTVLLLQFRKWWVVIPLLSAFYLVPVHTIHWLPALHTIHWLPALPFLVTVLVFAILCFRKEKEETRTANSEQEPPTPEPVSPLGRAKVKRKKVQGPRTKKSQQQKSKSRLQGKPKSKVKN